MNFHETLGVPSTATPEEIKTAYRKKVMESHPDRNPGDAEAAKRFLAIQAAYEALTDPNYQPHQTGGFRQTYQTKAPPRPANGWIKDAPPPTHDIWGEPLDPKYAKPKPKPRRPTPRPVVRYEPEVDLWKSMESKSDRYIMNYWREYNRLKNAMAYEEPEKFWVALEEWVKKNKS